MPGNGLAGAGSGIGAGVGVGGAAGIVGLTGNGGMSSTHHHSHQVLLHTDEVNSLDDVVAQCSSEILKRVESARRSKDEKCPLKGVQRIAKKGLLGGGSGSGMMGGDETLSRGGALSEKSSDSGVSSSSLSSGPIKNNS